MELCENCKKNPFKYKCPRCSFKSCSLDCSKSHKIRTGCSGERSKTHYVSLKQYSHNDMMSDYGYLEDVSRRADTLSRLNMKNDPQKLVSKNATAKQKELLKQTKRLGINLSMLPAGMKRRKLNCTNFAPRQQTIFWTVECIFASCNDERVLQHKIPSSKSLREIFDEMLFQETPFASSALTRYKLKNYIDAGTDSFVIGLKKEFVPAAEQKTYINLTSHMDASFVDALKGESLCEFPTLCIWLQQADPVVVMEEKNEKAAFRSINSIIGHQSREQSKPEEEAEAIEEMEGVTGDAAVSSSDETESSESISEESSDSHDDKDDDSEDHIDNTNQENVQDGNNNLNAELTLDLSTDIDNTSHENDQDSNNNLNAEIAFRQTTDSDINTVTHYP